VTMVVARPLVTQLRSICMQGKPWP